MAILAPVTADADGTALTFTAAAASQQVSCGNDVWLAINNADASPHTLTINDPNSVAPKGATGFDPDDAIVVAAGATVVAGPIKRTRFGNASGLADLAWSATTSMTIAVFRAASA